MVFTSKDAIIEDLPVVKSPEPSPEPDELQPQQEEGTDTNLTKDIFPQINPDEVYEEVSLKRSDSALNIFDQTTILKLFSAKNWTETFFNRIFRKKFLVISPGCDAMVTLKNGFGFELSQNYPRDFFLPAIVSSEQNKRLANGLLFPLFLSPRPYACMDVLRT